MLESLGLSADISTRVECDISAIAFNISLSTEGYIISRRLVSSVSVNKSISMIVNLSSNALSITRVEVNWLPMFAVATKHTPSATLIVGEFSCSSNLKYL